DLEAAAQAPQGLAGVGEGAPARHHVGERRAVLRRDRELEVAQHPLDGARGDVAVAAIGGEERHLVLFPLVIELVGREGSGRSLPLEVLLGPRADPRLPIDERAVTIERDRPDRHGADHIPTYRRTMLPMLGTITATEVALRRMIRSLS